MAVLAMALPARVSALDLSTYAEKSRLAEGNWVKISVDASGVYLLTNTQLRQMGFSDPSKVKIFGYGARRLPDKLDQSFVDDLPVAQSVVTSRGIIFYALGPDGWKGAAPVNNPFTTSGYYFVSDVDADIPPIEKIGSEPSATSAKSTFTHRVVHEKDIFSPGQTGHFLAGENFKYTQSQSFDFSLPGCSAGTPLEIRCSFIAKSTENSTITIAADGETLAQSPNDRISAIKDGHTHFAETVTTKTATASGDKLRLNVRFSSTGTVTHANLDYLVVSYQRKLEIGNSQLSFTDGDGIFALSGASASTRVWLVNDPSSVYQVDGRLQDGTFLWRCPGENSYVVFDENGSLPSPKIAGRVANQNLHGVDVPDMVIFAPTEWLAQARRLAQIHSQSSDSLDVLVVDQQLVFNEFASGAPDANAFRKMLKMIYDRGQSSAKQLSYVLFFGRGTHDNRHLTPAISSLGYPTMPLWQTDCGNSDNESFSSDDIHAFLLDNSGVNLAADTYCVAVGRMPVTSLSEARDVVDKIVEYTTRMPRDSWRNRVMLIADDKDSGIHMTQTETMHANMAASDGGGDIVFRKLYTDAYELIGNTYPAAREAMFRNLDEGVAWMTYIGHASTSSWSHEGLLTYSEINNMYLRCYPMLYAATCDFLRFDGASPSGAEIMWKLPSGGIIAAISANRPVYISDNGNLSASMGRWMFARDAAGQRLTIGQIYKNAKNDFRLGQQWAPDENKLRYTLIGDPALRPIVPTNRVVVDRINGVATGGDEQPVVMGLQQATMEGRVVDTDGTTIDDFSGILASTIYDAEYSVTTHGYSDPEKNNGKKVTFEQTGDRLYAGNDSIKNGRFAISIPMPAEIAGNFRPAAASFFAYDNDKTNPKEAAGVNRDFYVFGFDDDAEPDTVRPIIRSFYLNHPNFRDGDAVNTAPMVIAEIADNRGLNMSAAGIGHQMTLTLDGDKTFNDVNQFFTPSTSESAAGTIAYQLDDINPGAHSLRLRVWDTTGNSQSAELQFVAKEGLTPKLYDVYTDANPASVEANFYLSHDRPDAMIEVTISVYNLMGQRVWSSTSSGRSDMYLSYPVTWDLTDQAGRRVPRGIYLYRASVKADKQESETLTHKIAVAAQ